MGIAKRDEGKKVNSNINVTPMVDVMLVLLIIFMVITPMLHKASTWTWPVSNPQQILDADKEDAMMVSVTRDGKVYLGADQAQDVDNLTTKVTNLVAKKADKSVYVHADVRTRLGGVVDGRAQRTRRGSR